MEPAPDPLLTAVELPYKALYFPQGFPARIETNDCRVIQAAHRNWSGMRLHFPEAPVLVRLVISEGEIPACPPRPVYRAQRNLLTMVADRENFGCCDLTGGFGAVWANHAAVAQMEYFRYCFVLGSVSSLIEARHLVSLHAACVALNGHGILLSGDSGAGKSSLSFACARRGFVYVSDDCSALVRRRGGRTVVGTPYSIRFRESARELFPELHGRTPAPDLGGEPSLEVPTAEFPWMETAFETAVDYIVLLDRRDEYGERAELHCISKEEVRARLYTDVWPRELHSTQERDRTVDQVLTAATFELRYRDLEPAVERLAQLARSGR